jgi:hypothetical protein
VVDARHRRFILLFWIPSLLLGGIMTIEILLQVRSKVTEYVRGAGDAHYREDVRRLRAAYRPFTIQHLHPYYLFFFPWQPSDRLALANAVCSLDADGFREPGPAAAGGRKLAVLLGGSTAFGDYASSNDTTITSNLNRLQLEYFFVNAGVPSWNSTQEVIRMAMQIAALKPSLVITLDGANDAALADTATGANPNAFYPAGTPENFDQFEALVNDAGRRWPRLTVRGLLPEIFNRIDKYTAPPPMRPPPLAPALVNAAARRYIDSLTQIAALSRGAGARYIGVFQPIAGLHKHVSSGAYDPADFADTAAFRDAAFALGPKPFELVDYSALFDSHFASVAVLDDTIKPDTIFMDEVHLSDQGNEVIARELLTLLPRAQ